MNSGVEYQKYLILYYIAVSLLSLMGKCQKCWQLVMLVSGDRTWDILFQTPSISNSISISYCSTLVYLIRPLYNFRLSQIISYITQILLCLFSDLSIYLGLRVLFPYKYELVSSLCRKSLSNYYHNIQAFTISSFFFNLKPTTSTSVLD